MVFNSNKQLLHIARRKKKETAKTRCARLLNLTSGKNEMEFESNAMASKITGTLSIRRLAQKKVAQAYCMKGSFSLNL